MRKTSPDSKVYEALSALADKRVEKVDEQTYYVESSDHSKRYTVKIDGNIYSSNDNATYWQHYAGYPIIAVLFLQGKLTYEEKLLPLFTNIPWKKLNTKYKNKYDSAIAEAFSNQDEETRNEIAEEVKKIQDQLSQLPFEVKGNREKLLLGTSL